MDELSEKLASILNDEESMNKVRAMAENLLGEKGEPKEDNGFSPTDAIGADEMQMIMKIMSQLKNAGNDARSQLLIALKPHLSEPRREKVDTAVKLLKMIEILPLLRESGILNI
ncbi:MAG: hypothetical protein II802_02480 [Clostridia bacterium]|nr:hypothetical protein [Clostridia bacterium]